MEIVKTVPELEREIGAVCSLRGANLDNVSELRLRTVGRCSVTVCGERVGLLSSLDEEQMSAIFTKICEGSLYAHRDSIANGYVTLEGGVRVGVAGEARYEGGIFVGIERVYSLVFRIPTGKSSVADELFSFWQELCGGMLVYAPAGVGKTAALRSLALKISSGANAKNVVIVDERREFMPEEYRGANVDVLRGYKRGRGIEIALRTLGAQVVVIDEIGGEEEMHSIAQFANSGVRILASAHARRREELLLRGAVRLAAELKIFEGFAGIFLEGGIRVAKTEVVSL